MAPCVVLRPFVYGAGGSVGGIEHAFITVGENCCAAVGIERRVRFAGETRPWAHTVAPCGLHPPQTGRSCRGLACILCKHIHARGKGHQFPHARRLDGLPGGNIQRVGRAGAGIQLVFERHPVGSVEHRRVIHPLSQPVVALHLAPRQIDTHHAFVGRDAGCIAADAQVVEHEVVGIGVFQLGHVPDVAFVVEQVDVSVLIHQHEQPLRLAVPHEADALVAQPRLFRIERHLARQHVAGKQVAVAEHIHAVACRLAGRYVLIGQVESPFAVGQGLSGRQPQEQ